MAGDVCQNKVKHFDNDLVTFGIWHATIWQWFGYWFWLFYGNCKTFGDNIKIFNNKNSFDNNLLLHWTKMLSFDNDLTFGNNRFIWQQQSQNALRVCKFRNKMADQHQHQQDEVRDSILTRLEMLLNDVTAAISPDPELHIINRSYSQLLWRSYRCLAVLSAQDPNTY